MCGQEANGKCFFIFVSIIRYRKPGLSMLVELPKRIHAVTVDGFDEGNLLYIRLYYK